MRPLACLLALAIAGQSFADDKPLTVNVWPGKAPGETKEIAKETVQPPRRGQRIDVMRIANVSKPTLTIFKPKNPNGTAVLIAPGGGYHILAWDLEGTEVAKWLNTLGVTAIVLKYRVPRRADQPRDKPPIGALQDAQRSLSLIRANAKEWRIHPGRVGMLGFSAGGHLTVWTSTNFNNRAYNPVDGSDEKSCRPDFAVLIYPAYLVKKGTLELSPEIKLGKDSPPMFFAHAGDDRVKAESSIMAHLALRKAGVPTELHVYTTGGHGFGLRPSEHPVSKWPARCAAWLKNRKLLEK